MPTRIISVLLAALVALPALVSVAAAAPQHDRCVILVSVDGLAGFYLDDPRADLPTLRRMASEGARASGMLCSFPTVTWPNHTTLVTGVPPEKHGVIGNNYFDRSSGKSVALIGDASFDKDQIVKVPTIYDVAHDAGLKTASVIWPATRSSKTLDWSVPDMGTKDGWERYGTRSWLAELSAAGIPVDHHGAWFAAGSGVQRDWLYTRMARQALMAHQPNLLLIHLVEVDHVEHKFGPRSDDAYWAVSQADDRVRDLVDAVNASPLRGKTTIFVCSDHGFFPIEKDIRPNVLLRQLGLIEGKGKDAKKAAWCLSQGGACAVYVLDDARRAEIVRQVIDQLGHLEGVEAVIKPDGFGRIGQPTREQDPHGADLWLSAKETYSFSDSVEGENAIAPRESRAGTHGYLPEHDDLLATCIIWGAGIKPGTALGKISNQDVAPTIARLLGVEIPTAIGQPLTAALAK